MASFIVRNVLGAVSLAVNLTSYSNLMCAINCVTYPLLGCVTIPESH